MSEEYKIINFTDTTVHVAGKDISVGGYKLYDSKVIEDPKIQAKIEALRVSGHIVVEYQGVQITEDIFSKSYRRPGAQIHGTSFPTTPHTGQVFLRTDLNIYYYWDGTTWSAFSSLGSGLPKIVTVCHAGLVEKTVTTYLLGSATSGIPLQACKLDFVNITAYVAPGAGQSITVSVINITTASTKTYLLENDEKYHEYIIVAANLTFSADDELVISTTSTDGSIGQDINIALRFNEP